MRHDESGDNEDESACVIGGEREGDSIWRDRREKSRLITSKNNTEQIAAETTILNYSLHFACYSNFSHIVRQVVNASLTAAELSSMLCHIWSKQQFQQLLDESLQYK